MEPRRLDMRVIRLAFVIGALLGNGQLASAETVTSTLTLDGLSRVVYGAKVYELPSGSTIRLRCEPSTNGAVAVRVRPEDARLATIDLEGDGGQMRFELADEAKGFMRLVTGGEIEMQVEALVRVTVTDGLGRGISGRVPIRLTTGMIETWSADGGHATEVEGMPTTSSSRGIQLVGSATAGHDDPVAPGAAVHVVLSGALDPVPPFK
jgi:hypothetical protein